MKVHQVFDSELDSLRNVSPALPVSFFTLCIGAALALAAIIFSGQKLTTDAHATFLALFVLAVVMAIYFGFRSIGAWREGDRIVKQIRQRT